MLANLPFSRCCTSQNAGVPKTAFGVVMAILMNFVYFTFPVCSMSHKGNVSSHLLSST